MNTAPLRAGTATLVRLTAAGSVAVAALVLAPPTTSADESRPVQTSVDAGVDFAAVDRFMRAQLAAASTPGAAVAITRGDQVLHVAGYGHDGNGTTVTGSTLFRIASLSKSFTAFAVMQLVDAGHLTLDDPVTMHLPDFRLADPRGADITVRQLLDQTSGLADREVHDLSRPQPASTVEAVTSLRSARLVADPGTQWNYHNPNYQVAARLVEVLSGEPFGLYLNTHIFGPAGMTSSTTFETGDQAIPGLADGHIVAYGQPISMRAPATFDVGAGGVASTAADMARWLVVQTNRGRAPDGPRLLTGTSLTQMHTASAGDVGYALGWDTNGPTTAPTLLEHSGNLLTFSAYQAILPASGYGVVVLLNTGSALLHDQSAIFKGLLDIVEGTDTTPAGPSYSQATLDTVLAFLTVAVMLLGIRGVRRSRGWAIRASGSWTRIVGRMLPYLAGLGLVAAFPRLVGKFVVGRDVTWEAATYGWPALVVLVLTVLAAILATLAARAWQMRAIRGTLDTTTS